MSQPDHLDDQTLIALLRCDESEEIQSDQQTHLDNCKICRERLEDLAADTWWWDTCKPIVASTTDLDETLQHQDASISPKTAIGMANYQSVLEPPSQPELLGRLDQYEVESVIGTGGMGVVFKGFDTELHRSVAIKMLLPHLASHVDARKRFLREARSAAAIGHEHVVDIYQVRAEARIPYLVMSFVAGNSLQEIVEQNEIFSPVEIVRYASQIASGLVAAHAQGVVHRDIKPSNILLQEGGEKIVITDFGLARTIDDASLTRSGMIAGTPHYMSPEQCDGSAISESADLFSLGCVMYFMATGHPPFKGPSSMSVMHQICHQPPRNIRELNTDISRSLANTIHRLLEKRPSDRFASASETAKVLVAHLAHFQHPETNPAPKVKPPRSNRKSFLRKPTVVELLVIATAVVCLGAQSFFYKTRFFDPKPTDFSNQEFMEMAPPRVESIAPGT